MHSPSDCIFWDYPKAICTYPMKCQNWIYLVCLCIEDLKDLFISTKPQKNPKDIIQVIKHSIKDLEVLYNAMDKT